MHTSWYMQYILISVGCSMLSQETTLSKLIDMNLEPYLEKLEQISEAASKEHSLEKVMDAMLSEWEKVTLS